MGTLDNKMTRLADAVRLKSGISGPLSVAAMVTAIDAIPEGGSVDDVRLDSVNNLTSGEVIAFLDGLDDGVTGGTCHFYSGGLTFQDDYSQSLSIATGNAVDKGWDIENLTVQGYTLDYPGLVQLVRNGDVTEITGGASTIMTDWLDDGNTAVGDMSGATTLTDVDLSGLQSLSTSSAMMKTFQGCSRLTGVDFSALEAINGNSVLSQTFNGDNVKNIEFPSLTGITGYSATSYSFNSNRNYGTFDLSKLESVSGDFAMDHFAASCLLEGGTIDLSSLTGVTGNQVMCRVFDLAKFQDPTDIDLSSLREVSGSYAFQNFCYQVTNTRSADLSSLTGITGSSVFITAFQGMPTFTAMTIHPVALSTNGYNNPVNNSIYIRKVDFSVAPVNDVYLTWQTGMTSGDIIYILNQLTENVTDKTIHFYGYSYLSPDHTDLDDAIEAAESKGWTVDGVSVVHNINNALAFKAVEANSTVKLDKSGSPGEITLFYRVNGGQWNGYTTGNTVTLANVGDYVEFYGGNKHFSEAYNKYYKFVMSGKISASGSVMSLMGNRDACTDYCFWHLFDGCTSLITAPQLPATTLANSCYNNLFYGCTNLITAPQLPATTLANSCYGSIFYGCTSLTTAPQLPATNTVEFCYSSMFRDCISLTEAPVLPATNLGTGCYQRMFQGCSSLTQAPELPATSMNNQAYNYMFSGCTSLNSVKVHFSYWDAYSRTDKWLDGVSATGTFYCPAALPDERGSDRIPTGWTKVDI